VLFYEYLHGDNGAGIGASHPTGWTARIAALTRFFAWNVETLKVIGPHTVWATPQPARVHGR
jgi:hypothetical protein